MKKTLLAILVAALALAGTALAQRLPNYYPKDGFQHTGEVHAVHAHENRIVIDDMSYRLSDSAVVHSLSSYRDSMARVRKGAYVGFRLNGQEIQEFWLLPGNYNGRSAR